jgi:hypothetical protein
MNHKRMGKAWLRMGGFLVKVSLILAQAQTFAKAPPGGI